MNKLLIILLAVCLVNVHAFVKRDTEQPQGNDIMKSTKDFFDGVGQKITEALNPEKIKKELNEFVDTVNKAIDSVKPKPAETGQ